MLKTEVKLSRNRCSKINQRSGQTVIEDGKVWKDISKGVNQKWLFLDDERLKSLELNRDGQATRW